ncbi:hypothetical protein PC9H_009669 [Pleurotus ostreatus]|uniref:Xylanolytic transcriptional activator regulatory domain-containing protein n=2 Tax=Pleurotus TaxID=5320 RepID=A0A8H7DPU3_PLEOS|nr:uncharacterized protein PC9H_009669 [Pleurotus ostreatus]KAF7424362.1 hypothetical protein PC9H_009669 [Pleurotus ostreatus]KAG9224812.1 hypothetical protein CCMSSC00406_0002037 [Pleurotus cornucopiae]
MPPMHLQIDPQQQQQQVQQQNQQPQQQPPPQNPPSPQLDPQGSQQGQQQPGRKRKKNSSEEPHAPSEPRRLRRSHEACARCRSKKIKASPQEDRHRQTLTPRGHTERIEHQLAQCTALLQRHIPGFSLDQIDTFVAREGVTIEETRNLVIPTDGVFQIEATGAKPYPGLGPDPFGAAAQAAMKGPYFYPPPGYPMMGYPPPPPNALPFPPPPPPQALRSPPIAGQYPMNPFPMQHMPYPPPPPPAALRSSENNIKGQDPQSNDMSTTQAIAKTFGVTAAIMNEIAGPDKEDLAVGSSGLTSGRDRDIGETSAPRDATKWTSVIVRRNSQSGGTLTGMLPHAGPVTVWLPKNREMLKVIVDVYFTRLNVHRPVFPRKDFEKILNDLYEGLTVAHDPGFVCSLYLILALGTLSELNHKAAKLDESGTMHPGPLKKLMPPDWPDHDEFFERALSVKPDLRVTISSLQALILLQWYLYTERQGRTLWRLVGSLVRLSVELGLHHDPTRQKDTFSEEECELRIRLWGIVIIHDRGTSILLGRPLGISPDDSSTPHPLALAPPRQPDVSEHFILSFPIADMQADIINSLYRPKREDVEADWELRVRDAKRIIKSMLEFRRGLPESYRYYFGGTEDWPLEKKSQLVGQITEDQGLTLLKLGIARILLLRALFTLNDLPFHYQDLALKDAVVTAHNIIVIHNQLIRFPDIAFFTSPIPLHIAAMIILYGHLSKCKRLSKEVALEDMALALSQLPRFRWRWERKDFAGEHPLIAKLAERVMEVNLNTVRPPAHPVLIPEMMWEEQLVPKSQQTTPTLMATPYPVSATTPSNPHAVYGPQQQAPAPANGPSPHSESRTASTAGTPPDTKMVEMPSSLFYPFFPDMQVRPPGAGPENANGQPAQGPQPHHDYQQLLAAAAHQYTYQGSADCFMSEERDPNHTQPTSMVWVAGAPPNHRAPVHYPMPPQP